MTLGLDTSVVLRLLTGEPAAMAAACRERLEAVARAGDKVVISDLVVLLAPTNSLKNPGDFGGCQGHPKKHYAVQACTRQG